MAELPILDDEQLRSLAEILWRQEIIDSQLINFNNNEIARNNYVYDSGDCYDSALSILDAVIALQSKYKNDGTLAPIVEVIVSYLIRSLNLGLMTVNNFSLRLDFLKKISDACDFFIKALEELDPQNASDVATLAKKADLNNNAMLGHLNKYKSTDSIAFSQSLRARGITFDRLVQMSMEELGFDGKFDDLEDGQKLQVYENIIEESGRGIITPTDEPTIFGPAEAAVLMFAAGMMVWDIFQSDYVIKTVTKDAVKAIAEVGGAMLGEIVTAALATEMEEATATALFVVTAGVLTGIGAVVFIVCSVAGSIIDLIFGSGGETPSTEGIQCFVSTMPDGVSLARQIVHG